MIAKYPDKVLSKLFICFYRHLFVHLRKQFVMFDDFLPKSNYTTHTTGTDRFFKTQKCIFCICIHPLSECVWARISARYVSLSALSANFLPSVWCLMSRSQPVPVSSLSQYIHSMLLRHNSDLFMTSISCAQSRSHASIFQCRLSQN